MASTNLRSRIWPKVHALSTAQMAGLVNKMVDLYPEVVADLLGIYTPAFASREEAQEWMVEEVNDECFDNFRFAFKDDAEAVSKYEDKRNDGCCGSADFDVIVEGRAAMIGCNYGH